MDTNFEASLRYIQSPHLKERWGGEIKLDHVTQTSSIDVCASEQIWIKQRKKRKEKWDVMAQTCKLSTWQVEVGGSGAKAQPGFCSEFELRPAWAT